MFSRKRFKLRQEMLAISSLNGDRLAISVPPGEIIEVLSGPRQDDQRMVDVLWSTRTVVMFTDDILRRGDEVPSPSRGQASHTPDRVESVHTIVSAIPQMKATALFDSFVRGDISVFEFLNLAKRLLEPELVLLGELLKNRAAKGADPT